MADGASSLAQAEKGGRPTCLSDSERRPPSASRFVVYGLVDPRDGQVHYIGQTCNLRRRLAGHLRDRQGPARGVGQRRRDWLLSLAAEGVDFEARVLETASSAGAAKKAEARWISAAESAGWPLTNFQHVVAPVQPKAKRCLACVMMSDGSACTVHYRSPAAESSR